MTPMEIRKMICKDNTQSKIILNPSLFYGGTREEDVKEIERLMNEESNSK